MSELSPAFQAAINAVQAELDKCYQRIDEREHALSALANELIYRGNSVAYIYAKKDAYAKCIDECCACFQMDGETSVAEYVKRSVERVKELERELSETRQLLWLAVNEAGLNFFGSHLGHVAVLLTDLPSDYEVETFKPVHSPGVVVLTARRTNPA